MPVQRPLFVHYPEDEEAYNLQTEYLFGRDLLVAPVLEEGVDTWEVYLPDDRWIHLWSGEAYSGGQIRVPAPMGQPPVFYRKDAPDHALFASLRGRKQ